MIKSFLTLFTIVYNFKKYDRTENNTELGKDNRYIFYENFESKYRTLENLNKKKLIDKLQNKNLNNDNKIELIKKYNFLIEDITDVSCFNIKNGGLIDDFTFDKS
jgi:hypothetical protein